MGRWMWLSAGLALGGLSAYRMLWRVPPVPARIPNPASTFEEARARVEALQTAEDDTINPLCRTLLLHHDRPTNLAVVLLHGYTNCPHQYRLLAERLHARGVTVMVPRLPLHGQRNRRPPDLGQMTGEMAAACVAEAVDIAQGLGDMVRVLGFSFGGVLAAWVADRRSDVDLVVLVSPSFGVKAVPHRLRRLYATLLPRLRDQFIWWDPALKEEKRGPTHAYLGFSRRGIAVLMRISLLVEHAARRRAPAARRVCMVINPSDQVVDNEAAETVARLWQRHSAQVELEYFPAEDQLIHDLMDPMQPGQKVDRVYPSLIEILTADR